MYSTKQVGNTEMAPPPSTPVPRRCRCLNHVVKRCFAYGGNRRSDATPTVVSITRRGHEPGVPVAQLTTGAAGTEARPRRSVRARNWSVSRSFTLTPCLWRTAWTRLISRGKSSSHSCGGT